jgi:hypothetical protein
MLADVPSRILNGGFEGLTAYLRSDPLRRPASQRLPFREFGLSIGIHAVALWRRWLDEHESGGGELDVLRKTADRVTAHGHLAGAIEEFWMDEENAAGPTWRDHLDINSVMLASSLCPEGYLEKG